MIQTCNECHKPIFEGQKRVYLWNQRFRIKYPVCSTCYIKTLKGYYELYNAWNKGLKKKCKTCGQEYLASEEFFKRDSKGKYQLSNTCLNCQKTSRTKSSQVRRANLNKAENNYKAYYWRMALKFFNDECAYCGEKDDTLYQEHIVPVSHGGGYIKTNIIPACQRCNLSKHDKDMETWYKEQEYFNEKRLEKIKQWQKT